MNEYPVGSLVKFRGRRWTILPAQQEDVLLLRSLSGSEMDTTGIYLPLEYHHFQKDEFPLPTVNDVGDFESARLLYDASRLLLRHGAGPFRSMGYLSFRPRPYQLVPLLMALKLDPVRMLIADDVGIGKTIEAGLIARELLDRGEIQRIAVICPPYLCDQWQKELFTKFNINAKVIRSNTLARLERALPREDVSVFQHYPHIIVSVDFVKSGSRKHPFILHAPDLVIVDEAHGCARPAGQSVSQQQRHQLISEIAKDRSKNLILVTATPHSGIEESFLSLIGLIEPRFEKLDLDKIEHEERKTLAGHFIQRRRADVVDWMDTKTDFPERISEEVPFSLSREYRQLFRDVYQFARELVFDEKGEKLFRRRVRYWAALALLRSVMSSPAAAKAALLAKIERYTQKKKDGDFDYSNEVYDPTEIESIIDVEPSHIIGESEDSLSENERKKLREFAKRADQLKISGDTKIEKTVQEVKKLLKDGYKPIIFCRFIATSDYVAEELRKRLKTDFKDLHVISITGLLSEEEREIRVEELVESKNRILVATDCLSEGINLQDHFDAVLHYDLPWNPNRLEQREGRVDRFGQKRSKVKAIILYGSDNPVDGSVLNVLLRKARKIHKRLGITVPIPTNSETVIETVLKALFMRQQDSPQMDLFDKEIPVIDIHKQWDRAADREEKSRSLFRQHQIQPGEVAKELKESDAILGSSETVERFVKTVCQRLNNPLKKSNEYWKIDTTRLPKSIQWKLQDIKLSKISFERSDAEDIALITRNHPLTSTLAEYLFEVALNEQGERTLSARCGVIRSTDVEDITTVLMLRLRFLIKENDKAPSVAEECIVTGFQGIIGSEAWLSEQEAKNLFETIAPAGNVTDGDRNHWLSTILKDLKQIDPKLKELANTKANNLFESYERLRKTIKKPKIKVEPILPVDVLGMIVVLPLPRV